LVLRVVSSLNLWILDYLISIFKAGILSSNSVSSKVLL